MKRILAFGVLAFFVLIAFQSPQGGVSPLMAILQMVGGSLGGMEVEIANMRIQVQAGSSDIIEGSGSIIE
jgi:hypothetical protein